MPLSVVPAPVEKIKSLTHRKCLFEQHMLEFCLLIAIGPLDLTAELIVIMARRQHSQNKQ